VENSSSFQIRRKGSKKMENSFPYRKRDPSFPKLVVSSKLKVNLSPWRGNENSSSKKENWGKLDVRKLPFFIRLKAIIFFEFSDIFKSLSLF
jgi:hypothetical protein